MYKIHQLLHNALAGKQLEAECQASTEGYTGTGILWLISELTRALCISDNSSYLEIGVFRGKTLATVAMNNLDVECWGIDNFSQFDKSGRNKQHVLRLIESNKLQNCSLIDQDFEEFPLSPPHEFQKDVGVFFIDGPHDYRSQYLQLDFYKQFLAKNAVIVVDDSNYEHVRRANRDWLLANPDFSLVFEAYTGTHPDNARDVITRSMILRWWNGVNVLYRGDYSELPREITPRALPPVSPSSKMYLDTHLVFSSKYASYTAEILGVLSTQPDKLSLLIDKINSSQKSPTYSGLNMWDIQPTVKIHPA